MLSTIKINATKSYAAARAAVQFCLAARALAAFTNRTAGWGVLQRTFGIGVRPEHLEAICDERENFTALTKPIVDATLQFMEAVASDLPSDVKPEVERLVALHTSMTLVGLREIAQLMRANDCSYWEALREIRGPLQLQGALA